MKLSHSYSGNHFEQFKPNKRSIGISWIGGLFRIGLNEI